MFRSAPFFNPADYVAAPDVAGDPGDHLIIDANGDPAWAATARPIVVTAGALAPVTSLGPLPGFSADYGTLDFDPAAIEAAGCVLGTSVDENLITVYAYVYATAGGAGDVIWLPSIAGAGPLAPVTQTIAADGITVVELVTDYDLGAAQPGIGHLVPFIITRTATDPDDDYPDDIGLAGLVCVPSSS